MAGRARSYRGRARAGGSAITEPATLPCDFVEAARHWLGAEAAAFLAACASPPALALRANASKGGLTALSRVLGPHAMESPRVPWWPEALLPAPDEAARLAAHTVARIGATYAQDPAALAAVALLDPQPGERILDLCAAPGGKSTAIADRLDGRGLLVGNDLDARRARELERTLERWGTTIGAVLALSPEQLATRAPGFFDRVLVDAPCSGEAMFARHAHAAADWSPEHVAGCAARQRRLLAAARLLLRPGGVLVYATCTFNPSENEAVVAEFLQAHLGDSLIDAGPRIPGALPGRPDLLGDNRAGLNRPDLIRCARLWPHRGPGAGHFVAAILAAPAQAPTVAALSGRSMPAEVQAKEVRELVTSVAPGLNLSGSIIMRGDHAFLAPYGLPEELAAVALSPGLRLAVRRGRTWRPAHALAMALRPDQAASAVAIDDDVAAAFLSGQPLAGDGHGIRLVTWHEFPIGWARARGGVLAPLWPVGR